MMLLMAFLDLVQKMREQSKHTCILRPHHSWLTDMVVLVLPLTWSASSTMKSWTPVTMKIVMIAWKRMTWMVMVMKQWRQLRSRRRLSWTLILGVTLHLILVTVRYVNTCRAQSLNFYLAREQVSLLKFPNHLGIEPKNFQLKDFQPPTTDHHSSAAPSTTFSAHEVARNTIRWRYSPNDPTTLQSNARFLYWSDGSTTLQLASNPTVQYLLPAKPLAPIQRNPTKPHSTGTNRVQIANGTSTYNASLDSHTYLTDPHEHASFLRITNHITTSITVQSTTDIDDEATARLQESLAAAVRGNKTAPDGGVGMININEDPELAKKKAEVAERDKLRAQRRRQNQEERERDRANRVLGRSGLRAGGIGAGGLTIGGLEDDDGMAATRPRATKPTRKPRRRNSEYSDDEEDYRNRGRTKEDEYDEDDGFLVGSDEEPEVVQDESEEEEALDDDGDGAAAEKPRKGRKKGGTEGDGGRSKKRRVVEDEDEE